MFNKMRQCYKFDTEYVNSVMNANKKNAKNYEPSKIKSLIQNSDKMVVSSLLKLYSFQTEEEKLSHDAIMRNNVGFNGCDAGLLTNIAKQCVNENFITFKQVSYVRNKILKYTNQLTKIANGVIKYV